MSYKRLIVTELSTNFKKCTEVAVAPIPTSVGPKQVLVRNFYVGVNASDVNFTAGAYDKSLRPPFEAGFEGLGEVVLVGANVKRFAKGDFVVYTQFGAYGEYKVADAANCSKVPRPNPSLLAVPVSALTAAISIGELANVKKGDVALVTAAAGGTGQFAVQLLKKVYGCHVIATCSAPRKVQFLKDLGADRVINYREESIKQVLRKEYPKGINVVYESVGGETLDVCLANLAIQGRLLVIGSVSGYGDGSSWKKQMSFPASSSLLMKSASMHGFFLNHFRHVSERYAQTVMQLMSAGTLVAHVDPDALEQFHGVASIPAAVEYLHRGENTGKVVVTIQAPPAGSKL